MTNFVVQKISEADFGVKAAIVQILQSGL